MKKLIKILLSMIMILSIFYGYIVKVYGTELDNPKIYCTATIDDNFADDVIVVVLNKEATFSFKEYSKDDFKELGEIEVNEITKETTEIVKDKYLNNIDNETNNVGISEEYRRILRIILSNKGKDKVLSAIKLLEKREDIESVEPSYSGGVAMSVPDEYSNYNNTCFVGTHQQKWWIDMIELNKVWELDINSENIRVGVIDSGIDFSHPDLIGKKSSVDGIDFFDNNNIDDSGHGTSVASIICGNSGNGGMLGVSQNIELISYKLMNNHELAVGYYDKLIEIINHAHSNNVQVLNYSLGGDAVEERHYNAFQRALEFYNGVFVCSSGNVYRDNDEINVLNRFPSNVISSKLITVGASTHEDLSWEYSSYGDETVSLFAPGECIYCAVPYSFCDSIYCRDDEAQHTYHDIDGYHYLSGTSQAAPMVSATAAIILSILNGIDNIQLPAGTTLYGQIKNIILDTVDIPSIINPNAPEYECVSGGRLNVYNAVKYALEHYAVASTYSLNNATDLININKQVSNNSTSFTNMNGFYKLNVTNLNEYEFTSIANNGVEIILYDEDFNEIEYDDLNTLNSKVHFVKQLSYGIYYLRIKFANDNSSGNINTKIKICQSVFTNTGNNNILSGYSEGIKDYTFINNNAAGFYKITLNAANSSGTIDYPEGCIKVYADEAKQQMLARLETIFYTLDAETQGDSNNVIVFLEYGESYYINIDLPSASYSSMYINIERLTNTYDIIESNNAEEHVILNENTTAYGDYIQRVEIHEAGIYTITFTHEGPQSEENLMGQEDPLYLYYAFYKEVYSPAEQFGDLEMIFPHIASSMGGTISFTFNLQPGVYYIGYYNKLNNEPMTISITS